MNKLCILKEAASPWLENNFPHVNSYIDLGTKITIPKKTVLISPGERCNCIYYLIKGSMKASLVHYDGQEKIISIMGPSTLVSEGLPNSDNISPILITALENCELVMFTGEQITEILAQDPNITIDFLNFFNLKYKMLVSLYQGLLFCSPPQRLCRLLCVLSDNYGELIEQNKKIINLRLTQNRLADLLGVSRVTIANILKDMREKQVIEIKQKKIFLYEEICEYCQLY